MWPVRQGGMGRASDMTILLKEKGSLGLPKTTRWAKLYANHLDPFTDFRLEALDQEIPSAYI